MLREIIIPESQNSETIWRWMALHNTTQMREFLNTLVGGEHENGHHSHPTWPRVIFLGGALQKTTRPKENLLISTTESCSGVFVVLLRTDVKGHDFENYLFIFS